MTSVLKNVCIDKLDERINEYNNKNHRTTLNETCWHKVKYIY